MDAYERRLAEGRPKKRIVVGVALAAGTHVDTCGGSWATGTRRGLGVDGAEGRSRERHEESWMARHALWEALAAEETG